MSGYGFYENVGGVHLAEREVIAADLDFERITEWRGADQCDPGAGEQTHFTETEEGRVLGGKFPDRGAGAHGEVGKLEQGGSHGGDQRAERMSSTTI